MRAPCSGIINAGEGNAEATSLSSRPPRGRFAEPASGYGRLRASRLVLGGGRSRSSFQGRSARSPWRRRIRPFRSRRRMTAPGGSNSATRGSPSVSGCCGGGSQGRRSDRVLGNRSPRPEREEDEGGADHRRPARSTTSIRSAYGRIDGGGADVGSGRALRLAIRRSACLTSS